MIIAAPLLLSKQLLDTRVKRLGAMGRQVLVHGVTELFHRRTAGEIGVYCTGDVALVRFHAGLGDLKVKLLAVSHDLDGPAARLVKNVVAEALGRIRRRLALGEVLVVQLVVVARVVHHQHHLHVATVLLLERRDEARFEPALEHCAVHVVVVIPLLELRLRRKHACWF